MSSCSGDEDIAWPFGIDEWGVETQRVRAWLRKIFWENHVVTGTVPCTLENVRREVQQILEWWKTKIPYGLNSQQFAAWLLRKYQDEHKVNPANNVPLGPRRK